MGGFRVRRSRKKGSVTPPNTKYVGRPSYWANNYVVRREGGVWVVFDNRDSRSKYSRQQLKKPMMFNSEFEAYQFAVDCYEKEWFAYKNTDEYTIMDYYFVMCSYESVVQDLKGKNLSCWCREDLPCHVDVLLRYANDEEIAKLIENESNK